MLTNESCTGHFNNSDIGQVTICELKCVFLMHHYKRINLISVIVYDMNAINFIINLNIILYLYAICTITCYS